MWFFAFEHIQQGNIRNEHPREGIPGQANLGDLRSETLRNSGFDNFSKAPTLDTSHPRSRPVRRNNITAPKPERWSWENLVWMDVWMMSGWMSGWCLDGCLDDICRYFKYIWKISGRRSIGSALFMICTMGRWERPGMQVAKASPELRSLKSVPKWGIPKSWGLPRGMEKQGLFGHVPAAGFFSHDDQKPA